MDVARSSNHCIYDDCCRKTERDKRRVHGAQACVSSSRDSAQKTTLCFIGLGTPTPLRILCKIFDPDDLASDLDAKVPYCGLRSRNILHSLRLGELSCGNWPERVIYARNWNPHFAFTQTIPAEPVSEAEAGCRTSVQFALARCKRAWCSDLKCVSFNRS